MTLTLTLTFEQAAVQLGTPEAPAWLGSWLRSGLGLRSRLGLGLGLGVGVGLGFGFGFGFGFGKQPPAKVATS